MPKENYIILWPVYFNSRVSRKDGRMVEKRLAVENPTSDEILKAVESLGYIKKREDGAYPRYWWDKTGKVVVERKASKSVLLKKVAQAMKNVRSQAPQAAAQDGNERGK